MILAVEPAKRADGAKDAPDKKQRISSGAGPGHLFFSFRFQTIRHELLIVHFRQEGIEGAFLFKLIPLA